MDIRFYEVLLFRSTSRISLNKRGEWNDKTKIVPIGVGEILWKSFFPFVIKSLGPLVDSLQRDIAQDFRQQSFTPVIRPARVI